MSTINVYSVFSKKALVTRESARRLDELLRNVIISGQDELIIDFQGIEAVTPSFIDELLLVVEDHPERSGKCILIFMNPPTRLSEKFGAIARAHQVSIEERSDGAWVFHPRTDPATPPSRSYDHDNSAP